MKSVVKQNGVDMECFYYPEVFDNVVDVEHAKRLTVTQEGSLTSEVRWEVETNFTINKLLGFVDIDHNHLVLDYGCGVGRLSKPLIDYTNCTVIGVDMSAKMRSLASGYVNRSLFQAVPSEALRDLGVKFDCAIAAWVLQHCAIPSLDIELIANVLKPKAFFFVIENFSRKIPIKTPADPTLCWMDDGISIRELLLKDFNLVEQGKFTDELKQLNNGTSWLMYQRK